MEKPLVKEQILHFITILTVSALLGYLTHDLMSGIRIGILTGIGFVIIGEGIIGKRQKKE